MFLRPRIDSNSRIYKKLIELMKIVVKLENVVVKLIVKIKGGKPV